MCDLLYKGPCTRKICDYYHPEASHSAPVIFRFPHHCTSVIVTERSAETPSAPDAIRKTAVGSTSGSLLSVFPSLFPSISRDDSYRMKGLMSLNEIRSLPPLSPGPATPLIPTGVEQICNPSLPQPTSLCLLPRHPRDRKSVV